MGFYEDDELMDKVVASMKNTKTCYNCKHLHSNNIKCDAFPKGIPTAYLSGSKEHTKSDRQENDVVWEYDDKQKYLNREVSRNERTERKVVECGEDSKKAQRVEADLTKKGYSVRLYTGDTWPIEYTVIGIR